MPPEIIINRGDERERLDIINPATQRPFHPDFAEDRTGMVLSSSAKNLTRADRGNPLYDITAAARMPRMYVCGGKDGSCKSNQFRVYMDAHPKGQGATQLQCERCGAITKVFQMKVPDMTHFRAAQMGLSVPELRGVSFDQHAHGNRPLRLGDIEIDVEE